MRERLDAIADKVIMGLVMEIEYYDELRHYCGNESILTEEDHELLYRAWRYTDDDNNPLKIRQSVMIIFTGGISLALTKLLCEYKRHKLCKIREGH